MPNLKKLNLEIFMHHIEKKNVSIIFEVKCQKKIFRWKKNVYCKSLMKWPIYSSCNAQETDFDRYARLFSCCVAWIYQTTLRACML